tara:strand:- start:17 stop:196 length:180 start_codon:yes stop_codon:yes gene_type:complete
MEKEIKKEEQGEGGSVGTIKIRKTCDMFYTYDSNFKDFIKRGEPRLCATCGQEESLHKR